MDLMTQKAGNNSTQISAGGNVTFNPDLKQVQELIGDSYKVAFQTALAQYSKDAQAEVSRRLSRLEEEVLSRFSKMEAVLPKLRDPSFQFMLGAATKSAAQTDKESDYATLVELMSYRMVHPMGRKDALGVMKAIEIVHKIDEDALRFLTCHYVINKLVFNSAFSSTLETTLAGLDNLYAVLPFPGNYNADELIDHLALLSTIRIKPLEHFIDGREYFRKSKLSGFNCLGIAIGSEKYKEAQQIISMCGMPHDIFVSNNLVKNYVRIGVPIRGQYDKIRFIRKSASGDVESLPTDEQYEAISKIESLYEHDDKLEKEVADKIDGVVGSFKNVQRAIEFWDSQKVCFSLTSIGEALSNVNARLYKSEIPELRVK